MVSKPPRLARHVIVKPSLRGCAMPDYVVMFPADNEAEWMAGTSADHQATFDTDEECLRR